MKEFLKKEDLQVLLDAWEKYRGKKTLCIDMDGVFCNFDNTAIRWAADMGISVEEFKSTKKYRQPNFYLELEPMDGAMDAIKELEPDFHIRFLSAPSWNCPASFTEKRLWIEKHLGAWGFKRLDLTFEKDSFIGHFLVDDRIKYGANNFIGEHIMFGSEQFPAWPDVVSYLKSKK